jgi:hypothetical protein
VLGFKGDGKGLMEEKEADAKALVAMRKAVKDGTLSAEIVTEWKKLVEEAREPWQVWERLKEEERRIEDEDAKLKRKLAQCKEDQKKHQEKMRECRKDQADFARKHL